ncbi:AAA family ATPase [Streptomyces purpureus]|uniref:AAA family ATPase n=1 Tax=Streptomyces purpureus TaxID=1951 RepID=UPI00379CAB4F
MTRYGHGLVPGRFCPPHAGHHHLVRTAEDRCRRLTVLVRAHADDPLPHGDRVEWMREIHPRVQVAGRLDDIAGPVDAVFGADAGPGAYADALARHLGAQSVCVDPGHTVFPVSAAAVRKDPIACWDYLEPPVRAALARRVVVLGAESSGATTMARALAEHYRRRGGVWSTTRYVPEYRPAPGAGLTSEDFPLIALRRSEREEAAARTGSPVLFCDGDAFAATIWHERYVGAASAETARIAARGRHHLWLLTDHRDVPLAREDTLRAWTTARLRTQLAHTGRRTVLLTGPHEVRMGTAVAAVDALLAEASHLTPVPETR